MKQDQLAATPDTPFQLRFLRYIGTHIEAFDSRRRLTNTLLHHVHLSDGGVTVEQAGSPMVPVWIYPHKYGTSTALEGVAAGVADASDAKRVDLCNKTH